MIKESKLSRGVLTAIKRHKNGQLYCQNKHGITDDPGFIWSRIEITGITKPVLMANCYLHCGMGLKDRNTHYLRVLSRASDGANIPCLPSAFSEYRLKHYGIAACWRPLA